MNQKKVIFGVLVMSMLLLVGCGHTDKQDSSEMMESTEETKTVVQTEDTEEVPEATTEEIAEPTTGKTYAEDIPEAYKDVLDREYEFILNHENENYVEELGESGGIGFPESVYQMEVEDALKSIGYCLADLDGNGIQELIVVDRGGIFDDFADRILEIYTIKDNTVLLTVDGWIRNRYYLLDDGTLYNEGSGGADYSIFATYKYEDDKCIPVDYYFSEFADDNDPDSLGWYHNTSGEYDINVSERLDMTNDEVQAMQANYDSRIVTLDVNFFKDYSLQ